MPSPAKITAAIAILQSAGYTVTPPVDSDAIRANRRKVGRPAADDDRIRALRGTGDVPLHTMQEIAEIVGCGLGTVKRSLDRTSV